VSGRGGKNGERRNDDRRRGLADEFRADGINPLEINAVETDVTEQAGPGLPLDGFRAEVFPGIAALADRLLVDGRRMRRRRDLHGQRQHGDR
jgi:hypothetical protein